MPFPTDEQRDRPWLMRTYAGHSSPKESNALYRRNLSKGQTGLSVAFDLPTQTGYDPDAELARGEVGKVGVPVSHIGDVRALFDGIPMEQMNTSMTINAPAMYLLALYLAVAEEHGADFGKLSGTTQNDIIKEYLSRGTYVFPPAPSLRLITDMIAYTVANVPKWNPINVCSYHLQEAGATPVQEVAFALCTAIAVLDAVRDCRAGAAGQVRRGRRAHLVLRQRRRALRRGDVQDARVRPALGRDHARALRRRGCEATSLPVRRAGELARAHRGAAGEQRLPHPARDACGHDVARCPRPGRPTAGLERGAGTAASVGSAVVAAHAAGARLRVGPARVRGPVRGFGRGRGEGRGDQDRRARRDRAHSRDGRRGRRRRVGLPEVGAGVVARAAAAPDRVRRGHRRRGEQVHRDRAEPAAGRRGRRHHDGEPGGRGGGQEGDRGLARRARRCRGGRRRSMRCATPPRPTPT